MAGANEWFLASQIETADNADIHENTTAREILGDFDRSQFDCVVTGCGPGGTVSALGRVLSKERPAKKLILTSQQMRRLSGPVM